MYSPDYVRSVGVARLQHVSDSVFIMAAAAPQVPRTLLASLTGHNGSVHVVRYSKGGATYVMSGGQDRSVRLWNPVTGAQIKVFKAHGYEVLSISIAHDNASFASSGGDRSVFVWDVATGATTRRIPGHMGKINAVEFNQDASVVVSGALISLVLVEDISLTRRRGSRSCSLRFIRRYRAHMGLALPISPGHSRTQRST